MEFGMLWIQSRTPGKSIWGQKGAETVMYLKCKDLITS